MLTPDLRKYLDSLRGLPASPGDEDIKKVLFNAGWNDESINDAVRYFDGVPHSSASVPLSVGPRFDGAGESSTELKPVSVVTDDIDFIEEKDDSPTHSTEGTTTKPIAKPALRSTADAGHSSQSVLYPDNSSRLGMVEGETQKEVVASVPQTKLAVEEKKRTGPPLMDLDTLAEKVPAHSSERETNRIEEPVLRPEPQVTLSSGGASRSLIPPEVYTRSKATNRFVDQPKRLSSIDGVRPSTRQPIEPKLSVPRPEIKPIQRPQVSMPDMRPTDVPLIPEKNPEEVFEERLVVQERAKERSSRRFVTRVGFIAILLGVGAAVLYAYVMGIGPFAAEGPYRESHFVSDFTLGLTSIKTAVVTASYDLSFTERGENTKPLPALSKGATTTLGYFFPGLSLPLFSEPDANFGISLSGNLKKNENTGVDFAIGLESLYGGRGEKIDGEINLLRVSTTTYFQVRKTPELPFLTTLLGDISKIEGEWISANPNGLEESIIEGWAKAIGEAVDGVEDTLVLEAIATAFDEEGVLSFVKTPTTVPSWKGPATRYTLSFNFKNLAAAIRRLANESLTLGAGSYASFADDLAEFASALERGDAAPLLSYLSENALMTVDVSADGMPLAIAFTSRMAPAFETGAFAGKELKTNLAVTLTEVNQTAAITSPTDYISLSEAARRMMDLSEDEYVLTLQLQRVSAIAQAIDTFDQVVGRLPTSLDELLKKGGDFAALEGAPEDGFGILRQQYNARPFLPFLPHDASTSEPFLYEVNAQGDDYTLFYDVSLPSIRDNALVYMNQWAYQFRTAETTPKGNGYAWRIVNGKNTMSKTMFSVEGKVHR